MGPPPPHTLTLIIAVTLVGGILSMAAGSFYLLLPEAWRRKTVAHLISLATGTLLAVSFIDLLPEAMERAGPAGAHLILTTVLCGVLVFFVLEKGLIWHHAHGVDPHGHAHAGVTRAGSLVMVGDTFHNFLDGILLTATFVADHRLGLATAAAIIAHEIPQEVGNFAIMLEGGFTRLQTFLLNGIVSLAMIAGALIAWWYLDLLEAHLAQVIAFTAASFIYISIADLIPSLHRGVTLRETLAQLFWIGLGVLLVVLVVQREAGHG